MNDTAMPDKLQNGKRPIDEVKTVIGTGELYESASKKYRFSSLNSDDNTVLDDDSDFAMQDIKADPGEEAFAATDVAHPAVSKSMPSNIFLPTPGMLYMSKSVASEEPYIAMVIPYYADIGFPPLHNLSSEIEGHHEMDMSPTIRTVRVNEAFIQFFGWALTISDGEESENERCIPAIVLSGTPRNAWVPLQSLILFSQSPETLREIRDVDEALDLYGQIRARRDLQTLDIIIAKKYEGRDLSDSALQQLLVDATAEDIGDAPYITEDSRVSESSEGNHGIIASRHQDPPGDPYPLPEVSNATNVRSTSGTVVDVGNLPRDAVLHTPILPNKTATEDQLQHQDVSSDPSEDDGIFALTPSGTQDPERRPSPPMFVEQYPVSNEAAINGQEFFIQVYWLGSTRLWSGTDSDRLIRLVENIEKGILEGCSRDMDGKALVILKLAENGRDAAHATPKAKQRDKARKRREPKPASPDIEIRVDPREIESVGMEQSGKANTCVVRLQAAQKRVQRLQFRSQYIVADNRTVPARIQARRFCKWVGEMNSSVQYDGDGSSAAAQGQSRPRVKVATVTID